MHFFEIISLESQQKCWHQHSSEKRGKGYFFTDFLRIRLYIQTEKKTHLKRSLNYMANVNIKTLFGTFFITKSLQKRL